MAIFSKKGYILLASVLADAYEAQETEDYVRRVIVEIAKDLAHRLEEDNPAFRKEHFMKVVMGLAPANSMPGYRPEEH